MLSSTRRGLAAAAALIGLVACGSNPAGTDDGTSEPQLMDVTNEYRSGESCYTSGYPLFRLSIDSDSQRAWLDFDIDNSADIVRDREEIYFRAESFPGFGEIEGWIRATVDADDPANGFLRRTALGELSYTLLLPQQLTDPFDDLQVLLDRAEDGQALLDPDDPGSAVVRFGLDESGNIIEVTVEPQQPQSLTAQRTTINPVEAGPSSIVEPPPDSEVVDFLSLPASTALLSSQLLDPLCRDPAFPGDIPAERQCIIDATRDTTVGEWIAAVGAEAASLTGLCP